MTDPKAVAIIGMSCSYPGSPGLDALWRTSYEGRSFFRDVLQLQHVDVGGGWLIFALPPSEIAVHPSEGTSGQRHGGHDGLA